MKKVLIWGTGKLAIRCVEALNSECEVLAFVESNVEKKHLWEKRLFLAAAFQR